MFLYEGNGQYSFYKSNGDKIVLSETDIFNLKEFFKEEECKEVIRDLTSNFNND